MIASHLEFLVEEPSMEAFLEGLLPRLLPEDCEYSIHPFRGKSDLKRNLGRRLRGYARWLPESYRIVVLVDRDNDDCRELKDDLDETARAAHLRTPSQAGKTPWQLVNRIVIEELEAWYFGDWLAVCAAYPKVSANVPENARYRDPDGIHQTWEAFERILKRRGYFSSGLRKIDAAREIAAHVCPDRNRSRSFAAFRDAIRAALCIERPCPG